MTLEALHIIKGIWTHETFSFEGKYFKCKDVDSSHPASAKTSSAAVDADA